MRQRESKCERQKKHPGSALEVHHSASGACRGAMGDLIDTKNDGKIDKRPGDDEQQT
jgi:hypothetical protein